jgi:hypothetical protein
MRPFMQATKSHQISVRVHRETDSWLEKRAGGRQNKAEFIRQLIEQERAREKEKELLEMFNAAAAEITEQDHEERESLLGGFDDRE